MAQNFNFPSADTPFLVKDTGLVSLPWYTFLVAIFQSTSSGVAGNANQTLHGAGVGYASVSLTADVSGRLTFPNFVRGTAGQMLLAQGAGVDSAYKAMSGDATMVSSGAVTVSKVGGVAFGSPTSADILIGDGANWITKAISGDASLAATGALTVSKTNGASFTSYATAVTGQLLGTATNDSANSGNIGEYISSTVLVANQVNIPNATATDVAGILLTAGDWDVWGSVAFNPAAGTLPTNLFAWTSGASATTPTIPNEGGETGLQVAFTAAATQVLSAGLRRVSLASTTSQYLSAFASFTVSTAAVYGFIGARRVR